MASTTQRMKGYTHATSAEDYLLQRVNKNGENGCWLWTIGVDKNGYGQCHAAKYAKELGVTRAHQMAYKVWVGEIPKGRIICHHCDNPTCVNPAHLYAGTWKSNVHDCIARGRYSNGMHKLKVPYEKVLSYKGKETCMVVGGLLGISYSRVCQIWRGEYDRKYTTK